MYAHKHAYGKRKKTWYCCKVTAPNLHLNKEACILKTFFFAFFFFLEFIRFNAAVRLPSLQWHAGQDRTAMTPDLFPPVSTHRYTFRLNRCIGNNGNT